MEWSQVKYNTFGVKYHLALAFMIMTEGNGTHRAYRDLVEKDPSYPKPTSQYPEFYTARNLYRSNPKCLQRHIAVTTVERAARLAQATLEVEDAPKKVREEVKEEVSLLNAAQVALRVLPFANFLCVKRTEKGISVEVKLAPEKISELYRSRILEHPTCTLIRDEKEIQLCAHFGQDSPLEIPF